MQGVCEYVAIVTHLVPLGPSHFRLDLLDPVNSGVWLMLYRTRVLHHVLFQDTHGCCDLDGRQPLMVMSMCMLRLHACQWNRHTAHCDASRVPSMTK